MFKKDAYLSSNVDVLNSGHQPSSVLIHELNHVLASWLCLRRFVRITQGDAVEQFVILGECHAVEVRLGRRRIQYPTGRTAQAAGTDAP